MDIMASFFPLKALKGMLTSHFQFKVHQNCFLGNQLAPTPICSPISKETF